MSLSVFFPDFPDGLMCRQFSEPIQAGSLAYQAALKVSATRAPNRFVPVLPPRSGVREAARFWKADPPSFKINPHHLTPGPHTQPSGGAVSLICQNTANTPPAISLQTASAGELRSRSSVSGTVYVVRNETSIVTDM
jgi:hypothetical protein